MALRRNLRAPASKPLATKFDLHDYDSHNLSKRIARLPQLANRRAMAAVCQMLKTGKLPDEATADVDWHMVDGSRQQMAEEVWKHRRMFDKKVKLLKTVEEIKQTVSERVERDCRAVTEESASDQIDDHEGISRRLKGKAGEYNAVDKRIEKVPTIDFGKESSFV